MEANLIDISVSLYFEVKDAEIYGGKGEKGYTMTQFRNCGVNFIPATEEGAARFIDECRASTAKLLGVPVECVKAIPSEEYEAATEGPDDDEEDGPDEDCIPQF